MIFNRISFTRLDLHPLFFITIAYSIGIAIHLLKIPHALVWLALTISFSWIFTSLYNKYLLTIVIVCFFGIGITRLSSVIKQHEIFHKDYSHKTFDTVARITDISPCDHPVYKEKLTVEVYRIKNSNTGDSQWNSISVLCTLYTRKPSKIQVSDTVHIAALTLKPVSNQSFNQYLMKEGIQATFFINDFDFKLIDRPLYSFARWIFNLREKTVQTLQKKINPRTFQLFASIFLGNKPVPKEELDRSKDHFNTWGVMHYLARSGLHMVIFVFVWQLLLNILPFPFILKQSILIALSVIYCLLSWASVSFIRAVLSFLLYRCCIMMRIATNFLHILTVVCLLVLLHNPLQLFFLDFQLSFGLTCALALFAQLGTAAQHNY